MNGYKNLNENKKSIKGNFNNKVDELQNKSNDISDIIDNLKLTIINKNNFTILNEDVDNIKKYIEQTNDITSNFRDTNFINIILKNMKTI